MKLIVEHVATREMDYITAYPDTTVEEVLRLCEEEDDGVLRYKNRVLNKGQTMKEIGLIRRHRLQLTAPKRRTLPEKTKRAKASCMITLNDNQPRAEMSCGHPITARALFQLCQSEFSSGKTEIKCPYVGDDMSGCGQVWEMEELIEKAVLDRNEHNQFMAYISETLRNLLKSKEHFSTSQEIARILNTCDWKQIYGFKCPTHRACPKCGAVIEHIDGCNQMYCRFPGCNTTFCFICLGMPCRGNCYLAPIQLQFDPESDAEDDKKSNEEAETVEVSEKQIDFVRRLSKSLSQIYPKSANTSHQSTSAEIAEKSEEDEDTTEVPEKQVEFVRRLSKTLSQIYSQPENSHVTHVDEPMDTTNNNNDEATGSSV